MNRLKAIQVLRDTVAHSGLDSLIDAITDDLDRYLPTMEPEERDHTRMILERLLDLQANAIRSATNRGGVMADRMAGEAAQPGAVHPVFAEIFEIMRPDVRAA